mmetsp:Transcript_9658/g.11049  ORF Transcript_9658/g.11049 Transcript_9658/m.11049 type:complete len:284 (-) Transcript_9658:511-1362(-)
MRSTIEETRRLLCAFFVLTCNHLITNPCHSLILFSTERTPLRTRKLCHNCRSEAVSIRRCVVATINENESDDDVDVDYENDDGEAKSQFGTKEYWDELYQGRGDFPMDEYQWYFGFEKYGKFVQSFAPSKDEEVLLPGIGNDPILLDLLQKGYTKLTAIDYSEFAIERQRDLLIGEFDENYVEQRPTMLLQMDARKMPTRWTHKFDAIVEKGALDAIYLSGGGNVERAANEFERILKPGGVLISVSGVVPLELRKEIFRDWEWIRDGSDDLQAGCFVLKKPKQ